MHVPGSTILLYATLNRDKDAQPEETFQDQSQKRPRQCQNQDDAEADEKEQYDRE